LPGRTQPPERSAQYVSRAPAQERAHRESQHAPKQTTSGYSYVSTSPPPAQPTRQNTPSFYSQANREGRSGYLSTPSPEPEQSSEERAPRPSVVTHALRPGWKLDPQLRLEARRQLADELFPLAVAGCFVLGVTGVPEARAHKPLVAAELALALAEARHPRVLLVEADFQWPTLHALLQIDMPPSLGFSQQLRARAYNDQWHVVEISPTLHVLAEGIMRSPGLILSSHFEDSLRSFRSYYDFVIADGPLVSAEVDCRAFDAVIDGVAIVTTTPASPWLSGSLALFSDKRYSTVVATGAT
jgi:Mrp family chromosome partitioning ATPase